MTPGRVLFFSFPNQFQMPIRFKSIPSAKESKYPRRKHVFTAREMSPARVLFSHFQMTIKSKYLRKHLCTAREMASGGVLVFSFPCLNSEESPDQLRFIPIPRKPEYEEWTLRSLLSFHCYLYLQQREMVTMSSGVLIFSISSSQLWAGSRPANRLRRVTVSRICSCQEIWFEDLN